MPLLKLWKSLFAQQPAEPAPEVGIASAHESSDPVTSQDDNSATVSKPVATRKQSTTTRRDRSSSRRLLSIGRSGPHAALCKQLRRLQPQKVLEITVGDGSRAVAILNALGSSNRPLRYVAIDQFELGNAEISLKEFHQTLRREEVRSAQLFPENIERGLRRVATTLGPVDLIVIAAAETEWRNDRILPLIARVSHSQTIVYYQDESSWTRFEPHRQHGRRAA